MHKESKSFLKNKLLSKKRKINVKQNKSERKDNKFQVDSRFLKLNTELNKLFIMLHSKKELILNYLITKKDKQKKNMKNIANNINLKLQNLPKSSI